MVSIVKHCIATILLILPPLSDLFDCENSLFYTIWFYQPLRMGWRIKSLCLTLSQWIPSNWYFLTELCVKTIIFQIALPAICAERDMGMWHVRVLPSLSLLIKNLMSLTTCTVCCAFDTYTIKYFTGSAGPTYVTYCTRELISKNGTLLGVNKHIITLSHWTRDLRLAAIRYPDSMLWLL